MLLIDAIRANSQIRKGTYEIFCIILASLFMGLLSQFQIPLWFTSVPITLQTLGIMLIAGFLGSRRASLALITYLAEGAMGFPVFTGGGSGWMVLAGPRCGYFLGFVIAAFAMGFLFERGGKEKPFRCLMICLFGSGLILAFGALWLSFLVGWQQALFLGVYPFILGSIFKSIAALSVISPFSKAE